MNLDSGNRILATPQVSSIRFPTSKKFIIFDFQLNQSIMSKGQDKKKEDKKPATKTIKEKRAEKKAKRATKNF